MNTNHMQLQLGSTSIEKSNTTTIGLKKELWNKPYQAIWDYLILVASNPNIVA